MADVPNGPGWWQASDGNWYPPELLPGTAPAPFPVPTVTTVDPAPSTEGQGAPRRNRNLWIWIGTGVVLIVGGAIALTVLLAGPDLQPVSVLVVDATGVANPVPQSLSVSIGSDPLCYPVFSSEKAVCKFSAAVLAGQSMTIHLGGLTPRQVRIRVPQSANLVNQTVIVTIHNKSVSLAGFGRRSAADRPDPFAAEVSKLDVSTLALRQKYEDPITTAYQNVFAGKQTAHRIDIYNAINPLIDQVKQGDTAAQALSSSNPVIEKWITEVQACWDDRLTSWQAEAVADNVNDPVAGADAANQAASSREKDACQKMNDDATTLEAQAAAA